VKFDRNDFPSRLRNSSDRIVRQSFFELDASLDEDDGLAAGPVDDGVSDFSDFSVFVAPAFVDPEDDFSPPLRA
jgi:hypothetical protein